MFAPIILSLTLFVCCLTDSALQWDPACGISKYPDAGIERPDGRAKRIVGGSRSRQGEFPWIVSIERGQSGMHGCNGFIIDSQWVVSAQHCYGVGTDPNDLTIWVQNFYQYPQDGTPHTPTTIVFHPDYDNESYEHDIVMMKLPTPLVWNEDLRPICMPEAGNLYEGADAWLAGWGNEYEGGPPTADLQHVQLRIITNDDCKRQVGPNDEWMVLPNTLCHRGDGKDAGDGDSGGAIMVKDSNNTFRVAGIQSWGYWPAGERPSVCTRITSHIDYINQVRQNN